MTNYLNRQKAEGLRGTSFYSSKKWLKLRDEIRIRDAMTCQNCLQPILGRSIVDHIEDVNVLNKDNWEIAYNPANLQLLCQKCHNAKTFKKRGGNNTLW